MFTRKDFSFFAASFVVVFTGFCLMALDTAESGFGVPTLWIAPPLLLLGLLLPVAGIMGTHSFHYSSLQSAFSVNKEKHLAALFAFIASLTVYLITIEPTASLWDCSEFIASAYKLQVPHTPGNPLLLLIGRIFAFFAFGDVKRVAICINAMSAVFSALTVYVVYYLIYFFGERLVSNKNSSVKFVLIASSLCGSLCLTFLDTFWFSAVEAETYGPACFFLVLQLALILKGKAMEEQQRSRLLILLFYVAGLAYCIHPMCILVLPVLPFAWYFHKRHVNLWNGSVLLLTGMIIVFVINRIFSTGVFELAFHLDLFLVNAIGLPFYSGVGVVVIVFAMVIGYIVIRYRSLHTYAWSAVFLLVGFVPYLLLFIRSNHNPPIDENNPQDLALIKAYMNRESYPSSPLLYGPYYDAQLTEINVKKKIYFKGETKYELAGTMPEYVYDSRRSTIFPRIYSSDADHVAAYRAWTGLKEGEQPGFYENLQFLFTYQIGHMYLRYLLWNFAGRESDHQDCAWLRPWQSLHPMINAANENKARNQYWMIPLALGLMGAALQWKRDRKNFYSTMIFFLLTGLILVVYLNSFPVEPRERDYIYVGSYIAFCIWIGLGTLFIADVIRSPRWSMAVVLLVSFGVPLWMAYQNFDDHNRAGRTFQIDNARNQLAGCAKNAILFTGGDNDTFPFWYLQDVEGFRTDVRVMVGSYMNTDWYINELRNQYYDSSPVKLTLTEDTYRQYGANDVLYIQDVIREGIDLPNYLQLLREGHKALTRVSERGEPYSIVPSRVMKLQVNAATGKDQSRMPDREVVFKLKGNYLYKGTLAMLDLIASNHWTRPVYFNFTSLHTADLELNAYVVQEGNLYRLLPINNEEGDEVRVDTQLSYQNLVINADYRNLQHPSINFNYEDYQLRIINPVRLSLNNLAITFLNEGNRAMAGEVMKFAVEKLYAPHLAPSVASLQAAGIFRALDQEDQAKTLCKSIFDFHYDQYQCGIKDKGKGDREDAYFMQQSAQLLGDLGDKTYITLLDSLGR